MIKAIIPDIPDDDADEGTLSLTVRTEDTEFELQFNYVQRATDPSVHTPFASPQSERSIYAWPNEEIPSELKFDVDTVEATSIVFETSTQFDKMTLLDKPYSESDGIKSPFVEY